MTLLEKIDFEKQWLYDQWLAGDTLTMRNVKIAFDEIRTTAQNQNCDVDKFRIFVEVFNEMMDVLYELYTVTEKEDRNGIIKSRCALYEYFRQKYGEGGVDNENK